MIVGTPSGATLAPEGGAHQSVGTPLTGLAQDGLAAFEPAFADELAVVIDWAFDYMQRTGDARPDLADWPRDVTGGSVYLRLSTRTLEQVPRHGFEWLAEAPVDWREPWDDWISTRYEQKALREGRTPHYLTFRRR